MGGRGGDLAPKATTFIGFQELEWAVMEGGNLARLVGRSQMPKGDVRFEVPQHLLQTSGKHCLRGVQPAEEVGRWVLYEMAGVVEAASSVYEDVGLVLTGGAAVVCEVGKLGGEQLVKAKE